jgi:hypothetical protein
MAFDLAAIRQGVKSLLETVGGLHCYDQVPGADIAAPAAVVQPVNVSYVQAMGRGPVDVRIRVTLLVSAASDRSGQTLLDGLLSAGTGMALSIVDAIEADRTLGGTVDSVSIDPEFDIDYGRAVINETTYWKADVQLKALRSRS